MVEGGGLENRCAERYRGFESYSLRQYRHPLDFRLIKSDLRDCRFSPSGFLSRVLELKWGEGLRRDGRVG